MEEPAACSSSPSRYRLAAPSKAEAAFSPHSNLSISSQTGQKQQPLQRVPPSCALLREGAWPRLLPPVQGHPQARGLSGQLWLCPLGTRGDASAGGSVITFTPAGMCSQHGSHSQHMPGEGAQPWGTFSITQTRREQPGWSQPAVPRAPEAAGSEE